jgi:hypothetical protein
MREQTPRPVSIIEKLAKYVPGYGGYLERGTRRSADQALREAIAGRLIGPKIVVERLIRDRTRAGDLDAIDPFDRTVRRIEKLSQSLRAAGSGIDAFYGAGRLDDPKADTLHTVDLALFERVDELTSMSAVPEFDGQIDKYLGDIEAKLAERGLLLQGIR